MNSPTFDGTALGDTVEPSFVASTNTGQKAEPSSSPATPAGTVSTAGSGPSRVGGLGPLSRVYSPTETANWLHCPVYRQFERRWEPLSIEWSPAILLGNAVQAGLFEWLRGRPDSACEEVVVRVVESASIEGETYTAQGLTKLALRGVKTVMESGLFDRHTILMVDEPLAHSRPDIVSRHETEGLGVSDFKVSHQLGDRWRQQRLDSYDTEDQFWHYAWEVGETLGEPVKWTRAILVILSPKPTALPALVRVTPERLNFWLQGAEQHWQDMSDEDQGRRQVVPRWPSCRGGRYGACEAYDACHILDRDESRYNTLYKRKGK